MGDIYPRRKDVVDRLKRRLDSYRQHDQEATRRYLAAAPDIFDRQKQESLLLLPRLEESKAKKAAKQPKSARASGGGGGGLNSGSNGSGLAGSNNNCQNDHRNLVVSKLKRKIDSVSGLDGTNQSTVLNNINTTSTNSTTPSATSNLPDGSVFNFDTSKSDNKGPSPAKLSSNSTGGFGNNNNPNNNNIPNNLHSNTSNINNASGENVGVGNNIGNPHPAASASSNVSGIGPSLSVQIVQQISGHSQQDSSQTIHTNVTVNSYHSNGPSPPNGGAGTGHSVHTSVHCKQEPISTAEGGGSGQVLNNHQNLNCNSNGNTIQTPQNNNVGHHQKSHLPNFINQQTNSDGSSTNPGDLETAADDDIVTFLGIIETGNNNPSLRDELNLFTEIFDQVKRNSESNESAAAAAAAAGASAGSGGMYPPHVTSPGVLSSNSSTGGAGGTFPSSLSGMFETGGPNIPIPSALPEPTGPAAETLKQLAAQHQQQPAAPPYGNMKSASMLSAGDPFADGMNALRGAAGNTNFGPPAYSQLYRSSGSYPGGYEGAAGSGPMTPEMAAAMGYNKPMSHYQSGQIATDPSHHPGAPSHGGIHHPHHQGSPSSLQQLQNTVQSHFKPGLSGQAVPNTHQQLHLSQSQHMHVSHGPHGLHMSQSQQMHMQQQHHHQQQQHVAMSQQQNFNLGQQQMMSEQMKMQMMEKMRMEQQQQHHQQIPHHQQRMPPQYMGRPPPEYKPHPNPRQGPYASANLSSSNPLQTMQNMVNQTSAYGVVKTEITGGPTSGSATPVGQQSSAATQITAVQQQAMSMTSTNVGGSLPISAASGNGNMPNRSGFNTQHQQNHSQIQQQPPTYSSSVESLSSASVSRSMSISNTPVSSSPTAASSSSPPLSTSASSTYTSAIMRNQRPPNVNIGPDGLNISQPRPHHWGTVRGVGGPGVRPAMHVANNGHPMMQYAPSRLPHYGNASANMPAMQGHVGASRGPGSAGQVMMTHQQSSIHMSQQMTMHASSGPNGSPGFNLGGHNSSAAPGSNVGYAVGGPSPGAQNFGQSPSASGPNPGYAIGGPSPGLGTNSNTNFIGGPSPGFNNMGPSQSSLQGVSSVTGAVSNSQSITQQSGFPSSDSSTSNQDPLLHFLGDTSDPQSMFDTIRNDSSDDFSLFEDFLNRQIA